MIALDFILKQGGFTLEIHERLATRVTALFGPSGAGKTTILDAIAGLRTPGSGSVVVGSHTLFDRAAKIDLPPHRRRVGYVPQEVALFPHMSVRANVEYGRRDGQKLALADVTAMLEISGLLDRAVAQLSGGERQRVALTRALMSAPDLLLLDEPLTAVDVERRRRILPYLERVRDDLGVPILYVTHEEREVRRLAEHVIVLEAGKVVHSGPPDRILDLPSTRPGFC